METNPFLDRFISAARAIERPVVLELGTKQSIPGRSTMHKEWIPSASEWLGSDIEAGCDVDIVADVHRLSETVGVETVDVVVTCSGMEHFRYPQLAAHEIMKVLKVGGVVFCQTHFAWPIHGYPQDYYRFTREALESLFPYEMGMRCESTYEFHCSISSRREPATSQGIAFLNVCVWGRKVDRTPESWVYCLPDVQKDTRP